MQTPNTVAKSPFPFRLGCTSYVIPADIVPNVEKMAPLVDDIELVLFESPQLSNIPGRETVRRLQELADAHGITYSVHFPTTHKAGSADPANRQRFVDDVRRVYERMNTLPVSGYVLHGEWDDRHVGPAQRAAWFGGCEETFARIAGTVVDRGDREKVCVESLGYPWAWIEPLVRDNGFSSCLDVGHAWLYRGREWAGDAVSCGALCRIVHLHGVSRGRDHLSIAAMNGSRLERLRSLFLDVYSGVVTLEVFNEHDTFSSIELLDNLYR